MADDVPAWRQIFDMLATPMGEKAASVTNSAEFSAMLMNFTQNWQQLNEKSKEAMSQLMHASNVPAYTDITKLSRQIGQLTGKVETLLSVVRTFGTDGCVN